MENTFKKYLNESNFADNLFDEQLKMKSFGQITQNTHADEDLGYVNIYWPYILDVKMSSSISYKDYVDLDDIQKKKLHKLWEQKYRKKADKIKNEFLKNELKVLKEWHNEYVNMLNEMNNL